MTATPGHQNDDSAGGPATRDRLLVAVDVDGTLLDTEFEDEMRPREQEAINRVREAGHLVAFCTGRNSRSLNAVLTRSGMAMTGSPMVLLNGAVIFGGDPWRKLYAWSLEPAVLRRLVEIFRLHDAVAMIYDHFDEPLELISGQILVNEALPDNNR